MYDLVRDRVKPDRDANNDRLIRANWWRFGRNREELRAALKGLPRYIATVETSKFRFFTFLDTDVAPDNMLVCIASDDAFHLGVLSSTIHVTWALAAGGRLGVGNDPRYNKTLCFDPFPFPATAPEQRARISEVAERLDQHRKDAIARDERVTMTGMYNAVEKLRSGEALAAKEKAIHQIAACGVLRDLHDELDRAVAKAYGWTWPLQAEHVLEHLVALHDERAAEEKAGRVRWLRPEYQIPKLGQGIVVQDPTLHLPGGQSESADAAPEPWPSSAWEQIFALQAVISRHPATVEEAARRFRGARRDLVARHLETLTLMGEVRVDTDGAFHLLREAA